MVLVHAHNQILSVKVFIRFWILVQGMKTKFKWKTESQNIKKLHDKNKEW